MSESGFRARLGDRTLFPRLKAKAYLNHGAISPPSLAVQAAMVAASDRFASDGVGAFQHFMEAREVLRNELAALIGAGPDEIAFVPNTSSGVLAVALCLPWEAGDTVVCLRGEFPTNVTPWQRAAELHGAQVTFHDADDFRADPGRALERLEELLSQGVRVMAVSGVQFQTGFRMPLASIAQICVRHGTQLFVDGIQACGIVPIDVAREGIDFMSVGSHKWLMGPEGCGFVYVRRRLQSSLRPVLASWLSHEEPLKFLFEGAGHLRYDRPIRTGVDFLEYGAQNTMGQMGLQASLRLITGLGVGTILAHVDAYLEPLEAGLVARGFHSLRDSGPAGRSGILSLKPPEDVSPTAVSAQLNRRGVACTSPDGLLRFAPHWPNDSGEVSCVLSAVDDACAALRAGAS